MVYVLIDSSVWVQDIDIEFLVWLENKRIIYTIVFTKADKNNQKQKNAHLKTFLEAAKEERIDIDEYMIIDRKKPQTIHALVSNIEQHIDSQEIR